MYLIRLDDASEFIDLSKWNKVEAILDRYNIKPIVGIIPHNEDPLLTSTFLRYDFFWEKALEWKQKKWKIALHGFNHVYTTECGGLNPIHKRSEFAGVPLIVQKEKIKKGYDILCNKKLKPDIFFAPSHTFDINTLCALRDETDIRIISDTIADNIYFSDGFYFIPQQTGKPRSLPMKLVTICLHPNTMTLNSFLELDKFLNKKNDKVLSANDIELCKRNYSQIDNIYRLLYFIKNKLKIGNHLVV